MLQIWRREIRRVLFWLLLGVVITLLIGTSSQHPFIAASLVLSSYTLWQWWQLYRLQRWLKLNQQHQHNNSHSGSYSASAYQLPDAIGIWGAVFHQTQRLQRQSERNQQQLQAVINRMQDSTAALKDAVLMVDSQGNLEWWNQAASRYLGLQKPVDIGQPITNLIRNPAFKHYFDGVDYDEPLSIPAPSDPHRQLQFNITLFGRKDRLLLVRDITRLKQLEQMRKDFVANVSHEMRTPLTVLAGYIETMQLSLELAEQELPPRWVRILEQMSGQSQRMENLISDLLVLSRLETTEQDQPQEVELAPLLHSIIDDANALSAERGHRIDLTLDNDCALLGYRDELHSAFSNLIFNAVKYTPAQGEIEIRWYSNADGGWLCVKDNGIGIDARHIPRLTERFYRADPSRMRDYSDNKTDGKEIGGTGLGLAIVKHILIRHQARLKIHSELNKGSEFCCYFPAQRLIQLGANLTRADSTEQDEAAAAVCC